MVLFKRDYLSDNRVTQRREETERGERQKRHAGRTAEQVRMMNRIAEPERTKERREIQSLPDIVTTLGRGQTSHNDQ